MSRETKALIWTVIILSILSLLVVLFVNYPMLLLLIFPLIIFVVVAKFIYDEVLDNLQ